MAQEWIIKFFNSLGLIVLLYVTWIIFKKITNRHLAHQENKTVNTFIVILQSIVKWSFFLIGGVSVLRHFIDISPIIYGLSFLGLAASMASQTLVKDIINGLINLLEGNIVVGETITVGKFSGTVENISLRSVVLRYSNGELQTIPFSEVTSIKNHSRDYSVTSIELILKPCATLQDIENVLEGVWKNLDEDLKSYAFVEPSLDKIFLNNQGVNIRISVKTKPDPKNIFSNAFHQKIWEEITKASLPLADPVK